ncbi:MAG: D-alanyl-D-alanine carboxypeptidase [Proteobacteria bacterium]|nr:D-alanyl-D-alanine carboxypeptidase [Pseudomonadota bacterium]
MFIRSLLPPSLSRVLRRVAAVAFTCFVTATAGAASLPPPPDLAARAWLLVDVTSGQTLASAHADDRVEPASLTKLMTAYLVFEALRQKQFTPSQMVNVSTRAWKTTGSRMFIEPRRAVSVDELMRGLIVQSGNDAAIALAELTSGSVEAFVAKMNTEAARLGLAATHFANPTGLPDPQHWSTAADLAKLATAIIRDYPEYYPLYSQKEFRYNNITQPNRNRLLWSDPDVDGMKTGHTDEAGFCLVASAKRGERRLLAVVLGAASDNARAAEARRLLDWGFQSFDTVALYQAGKPIASVRVWKGTADALNVGFLADRYVTLPKGRAADLKLTLHADEPLLAPIKSGQPVGSVAVRLDDTTIAQFPLIALADVPEAGFAGRWWDALRLKFRRAP